MAVYPTVRDEQIMTLNIVVLNIEQDPDYLNRAECPYSETVKSFFRKRIDVKASAGSIDLFGDKDELLVLDEQVVAVINDLESFGRQISTDDVTEKMGYFRTKTALIEKLITMRERLANLKEINDFRVTLLRFMDETLNKNQITALMKKLDGALGSGEHDIL